MNANGEFDFDMWNCKERGRVKLTDLGLIHDDNVL